MSNYRADFFSTVFASRMWSSNESASGFGSDFHSTRQLVAGLPALLQRLEIRSMLDIPCGDFYWMKDVPLEQVSYIGGDIVPALIEQNTAAHARPGVRFAQLDLVKDDLPAVDMVFVRDCFIHFTNALIFEALHNIVRSGSKYLCTTHDTGESHYPGRSNIDLERAVEGVNHEYRPINFNCSPFGFPPALDFVADGPLWYDRKVMAVWSLGAIKPLLPA